MTISGALSATATNIAIYGGVSIVIRAALAWYAMHTKGDVRVELSRGKTVFTIEAKERSRRGK